MSTTDIFQAALDLPYEVRSQLAQQLWESLGPPGEALAPGEWEKAWAAEIDDRLKAIDSGEMPTIDADVVHERIRQRLARKAKP